MIRKYLLNKHLVSALALWACVISIPPSNALALPSESILGVGAVSMREAQIQSILAVVSRPDVRVHLMAAGISEDELKAKLSDLDDAQLAIVSEKAEAVRAAGSDAGIVIGVVIAILIIILLIVVIGKLID